MPMTHNLLRKTPHHRFPRYVEPTTITILIRLHILFGVAAIVAVGRISIFVEISGIVTVATRD